MKKTYIIPVLTIEQIDMRATILEGSLNISDDTTTDQLTKETDEVAFGDLW